MKLFDDAEPDEVLTHPRHQAAQQTLVKLIEQLRACENVKEGYEFQQELLTHRLAVEEDRNAFSQAVKRMRSGKQPQPGAPQPQSGQDVQLPRTWQLEYALCERVVRQLQCVGDALAWRVFGFERRHIVTLCRNDPPGVMAGKEGLIDEREAVKRAWTEDGEFALMHDLTNCLRIGDVTVFRDDGPHTIEVKKNPQKKTAQRRRLKAAELALRNDGQLPGSDLRERLYDLDVPFKTHLALLATGTERAAQDGIFTAKVPGDRALIVTDFYGVQNQGWTEADWNEQLKRRWDGALRRARIDNEREWNVDATSLDSVSRDPKRVPFASYPLHSVICARLIGDLTVFFVETSGPALADTLFDSGLDAEWVRPPNGSELRPGEVVMELTTKTRFPQPGGLSLEYSRTLQMRRSEVDRYLIEMLDRDTWIEGLRYLLADHGVDGKPWPLYRNEDHVWV